MDPVRDLPMPAFEHAAIVSRLYDGCLDDTAWNQAIQAITNRVRGASAVLFGISPSTNEVFRAENHGSDPGEMQEFRQRWAAHEIRTPLALQHGVGEPIFDARLMPSRTWKNSVLYNEFLLKIDKPWILSFWLDRNADKANLLTIHGSLRRGQFDERDGALIQGLIPHLRRAQQIRMQLAASQVRAEHLGQSLDCSTFAIFILDATGRILEANAMAEAQLRQEPSVTRSMAGELRLREPANAELLHWIGSGTPHRPDSPALIHVPREPGRPISALVTPLPSRQNVLGARDPRWLVMLFDIEQRTLARAESLSMELHVSIREAQVAALLFAGYGIHEVATTLRMSPNTARSHAKMLYAKTGARSRGELIGRIAGGATIGSRPPHVPTA
jgi:DNA-binding CsgD family transcriptional regulator/PAS domain-containing protein